MPPLTKPRSNTRWVGLTKHQLAVAIRAGGRERESRITLKPKCAICSKAIKPGTKYYDADKQKYAHKFCIDEEVAQKVTTLPPAEAKGTRVVTHKMKEQVEQEKAALAAKTTVKMSKKRTPRVAESKLTYKEAEEVAAPVSQPILKVSEALPGAVVTLTITGAVEAVQRALDKLQN
jgi:hypothetical protein